MKPGHALPGVDDIQGAQDGIASPGQDRGSQSENRHRSKVRAKPRLVAHIFESEDEQGIEPRPFHDVLSFLQPLDGGLAAY